MATAVSQPLLSRAHRPRPGVVHLLAGQGGAASCPLGAGLRRWFDGNLRTAAVGSAAGPVSRAQPRRPPVPAGGADSGAAVDFQQGRALPDAVRRLCRAGAGHGLAAAGGLGGHRPAGGRLLAAAAQRMAAGLDLPPARVSLCGPRWVWKRRRLTCRATRPNTPSPGCWSSPRRPARAPFPSTRWPRLTWRAMSPSPGNRPRATASPTPCGWPPFTMTTRYTAGRRHGRRRPSARCASACRPATPRSGTSAKWNSMPAKTASTTARSGPWRLAQPVGSAGRFRRQPRHPLAHLGADARRHVPGG